MPHIAVLARVVAAADQPEDQRGLRQCRLRKLAEHRDAAIGRVEDEDGDEVEAARVTDYVEVGDTAVGIHHTAVAHGKEAAVDLPLLALHLEARVGTDKARVGTDKAAGGWPQTPGERVLESQDRGGACSSAGSEGGRGLKHISVMSCCWKSGANTAA